MVKTHLLLIVILVFAINSNVSWSGNDYENYILGLRYPKSYDVIKYPQKWADVRAIGYKVHLSFPAKEVLYFYDAKFKEIGWSPFIVPCFGESNREWDHYFDGIDQGQPIVHQLFAAWTNKDHSRAGVLVIKYYSTYLDRKEKMYATNPNNDIQNIILQIEPFNMLPSAKLGK
jgi:hypothetical protein